VATRWQCHTDMMLMMLMMVMMMMVMVTNLYVVTTLIDMAHCIKRRLRRPHDVRRCKVASIFQLLHV
jgi:hypothetical protein